MVKLYKSLLILLFTFFSILAFAQNTSNKGTEFWVIYAAHVDNTHSRMYLYLTSDVNTTAAIKLDGVDIPGSPFAISANQVTPVEVNPEVLDAYVGSSDVIEKHKSIQVTSGKPIAVYSHIFISARSAATLVLPAKVLGKEYYTSEYVQNVGREGSSFSYSSFSLIAVEDNTTVEITPKAADLDGHHAAGQTFSIQLQKGEIYQYLSKKDLSGSHIVAMPDERGKCKTIAVYSGSSWVGFCSNVRASDSGGDNLYQQLYPVTSWGKAFITAPFINKPYDIFRVYFSKDGTKLTLNGTTLTGTFNQGDFYEFTSSTANQLSATEPISLVQYQISQGCDVRNINGPLFPGDPEMTVLNPVEQTLSSITVYSALKDQTIPPTRITQHYINVIIKAAYKDSFRINGMPPEGHFVVIPGTDYVYLQENVSASSMLNPTHTLRADGGFSAIAYGYGNVESYGYLAGADVKNLYQNLQVSNAQTQLETPDVCTGIAASFTLTLPYQTPNLIWTIDGQQQPAIANPAGVPEVINGVTVYKYKYAQDLLFNEAGSHEVKVNVLNPNPTGCDPNEELSVNFGVYDLPVAAFTTAQAEACAGSGFGFTDQSIPKGKPIVKWHWDFGDGTVETRTVADPFTHTYTNPGDFTVTLSVESESGCQSEVVSRSIHVNRAAAAKFIASNACAQHEVSFTDQSSAGEGTIVKWHWDFGDPTNSTASNPNQSTSAAPVHTFNMAGIYTVSLVVETDKGCVSTPYAIPVVVAKLPVVNFDTQDICASDAPAVFHNTTTDFDGSTIGLRYKWDFGDPASGAANYATTPDGQHQYHEAKTYTVKLEVTNANGCTTSTEKSFTVNGATPVAGFRLVKPDELCSNADFLIMNTSTIDFGRITRLEWYMNGNKIQEEAYPPLNKIYAFNYPAFSNPLTVNVRMKLVVYSGRTGGDCNSIKEQVVTLKAAPVVLFPQPAPVCVNAGLIPLVASETGNSNGSALFSGPGVDPSGFFDPAAAGVGIHEIRYQYTSLNGCQAEARQDITVYPAPSADAGADFTILAGGEKNLNGKAGGQYTQIKWSPAAGLDRDDILNPLAKPEKDTEYTLTVTSAVGCTVSDRVMVKVLQQITIPNAFSPNGDNINDVWNLANIDSYPNATVDIFNRYGEKVFYSKGYAVPFDGNYKGQPLPVGTYYFLIDPKNGRKVVSGSLTLIR